MPGWLEVVVVMVGSGGLAGLLVGLVAPRVQHALQWRRARVRDRDHGRVHGRNRTRAQGRAQEDRERERERGDAAARAAWVAQQREICTALLDAVSRWNTLLLTFRSLHDLPASRFAMQDRLESELHQLPLLDATVRSFWRELTGESQVRLQAAVERFDTTALAYQEALLGPRSAQWHVVQRYIGTTPPEEVRRRAEAYDARRRELELAVRAYMASLEAPAYPIPARGQPRSPRQRG